jgi:hypothetical protein
MADWWDGVVRRAKRKCIQYYDLDVAVNSAGAGAWFLGVAEAVVDDMVWVFGIGTRGYRWANETLGGNE